MFKSINLKKVTATSLFGLLMAGAWNAKPVMSTSGQAQPDMIKLSFLLGEFQCGSRASLAEFELSVTTANNSTPITLRVGDSAFVEASSLQDVDIDVTAISGGSCINWSNLADPVYMGSNDSFPNYINPSIGTYNQTPLDDFQAQLSASEGFMLMELGGHRYYSTQRRYGYDWNDVVVVYDLEPNLPPTANNGSVTTDHHTAMPVDDVINDFATDPEGGVITLHDITILVNGTETSLSSSDNGSISTGNGLITTNNGQIVYTPDDGFSGDDSFNYIVQDAEGNESSGEITVTVLPRNEAPTAADGSVTTPYNTAKVINAIDDYVTDPDGDVVTIENVAFSVDGVTTSLSSTDSGSLSTTKGQVTIANGQIVYTPNDGVSGGDSFNYTVKDAGGEEASGEITVNVNPMASDFTVNTPHNTKKKIGYQTYSKHIGGNTLTLDSISFSVDGVETSFSSTDSGSLNTTNGKVKINSKGKIVYTPNFDFSNSSETFSYTVKDVDGNKSSAKITVDVGRLYAD